jgi:F0F1-type ATP synthase beta subunit
VQKKTESDKPKNRVIQGFYEILHGIQNFYKLMLSVSVISNMTIKFAKLNEKPGNSVLRISKLCQ